MSKDIRNFIDKVNLLNESVGNTTMEKLIKTAERDGHISGMETSASYITAAAKEIAAKWDVLNAEEKKVYRTTYYDAFLTKIGKKTQDGIELNF